MRSRASTILCVFCALLCLAILADWGWSYWRRDYWIRWNDEKSHQRLSYWDWQTQNGKVICDCDEVVSDVPEGLDIWRREIWRSIGAAGQWHQQSDTTPGLNTQRDPARGSPSWLAHLGIMWNFHDSNEWGWRRFVTFPHWPLALVTGLWPAIRLARFSLRRRRRTRLGLCARCGYDLTGNVSGVCPECGVPVPVGEARQTP